MRERLSHTLGTIRGCGNYRTVRFLKPLSATRISCDSREYLNLCSNSYLSLHVHPQVIEAARRATDEYGVGTCSSRSVSGSIDLYRALESEIAVFKGYEKALVFSNGYMANMGIIPTIAGGEDVIFSDELNHSSLIDAMRLSPAKKVIYRHGDVSDLEQKIKGERTKGSKFVVTETVFSMDGHVAPLADIYDLKEKYGFQVMVDDAHGTGVFGAAGRGVEEVFGLAGSMDVHMGTFGKALGCFGAFALADSVVIDFLINRARTFMYTTALPASILAGSLAALRIIGCDDSHRVRLWRNIDYMRKALGGAGFDLKGSQGPIIPIVVGPDEVALKMQKMLMEKGLFLQAIRPPTVPKGSSRLRLTVVSGFTQSDMDSAVDGLVAAGKKMGLVQGG
jgi:8-amino-7-oxononanoate synthase